MIEGKKNPDDASVARLHGQCLQPSDYRHVALEKEGVRVCYENPIPLLKDRTISPCLKEMVKVHILPIPAKALSIPFRSHVSAADKSKVTPLLCHFVTSSMGELGYEVYLDAYRRDDRFSVPLVKSALLLKLVSKEMELKSDEPRQFAAQTVVNRQRRQVTEVAVGDFLQEFSNEHTMTSSEVKLQQQLEALRRWEDPSRFNRLDYLIGRPGLEHGRQPDASPDSDYFNKSQLLGDKSPYGPGFCPGICRKGDAVVWLCER